MAWFKDRKGTIHEVPANRTLKRFVKELYEKEFPRKRILVTSLNPPRDTQLLVDIKPRRRRK